VGGQIPLAAGMAFASKYRNEDRVTVCSFGDAASNQGALHETFNMAVKWKLPVLYIVENNKYGMGTDIARVSSVPEIHQRGPGWDMRSESVDGMDVLAVYEKAKELVEWIRAGNGPVLLEAFTYRFRGHSMSDAATYRTKEEVEYEKQRDPIIKLRQLMMDKGLVNEAQLETIDEEQKIVVEKALAFADASPLPPDSDVWSHGLVEDGEADVKPRERVLGATDVQWPQHPTDFKVTWDLEPRAVPPEENVGPRANAAKKGAA
jgi:pyruvate dehydrogenase E1 component alpha subunit